MLLKLLDKIVSDKTHRSGGGIYFIITKSLLDILVGSEHSDGRTVFFGHFV